MSKRKKNLEKVIQQCQKTLDKIDEELAKPEPKLTLYDIEILFSKVLEKISFYSMYIFRI